MTLTIPFGFFLRLITHDQLAALDKHFKKLQEASSAPAKPAEKEEEVELMPMKNNFDEKKNDPESINTQPVVVGGNGASAPEKEVESTEEKKKKRNVTAAFAYFKQMPSLFMNPTFLLHAVHFAVIMGVEMLFVSVSFDSFISIVSLELI